MKVIKQKIKYIIRKEITKIYNKNNSKTNNKNNSKNNNDNKVNDKKIVDNCGREKLLGQHPLCEQAIDSTPSAKTREKKKS